MRRIYRTAKSAVVLCLVFMMTVDTANACRLFHWLFAHRAACTTSCAAEMGVTMAAPEVIVSGDCCCESVEIVGEPVEVYADFPVAGEVIVEEVYAPHTVVTEEAIMDASPVDLAPADTIVAPAVSDDDVVPVPTPAEDDPVVEPVPDEPEVEPAADDAVANPLDDTADDDAQPTDDAAEEPAGDDLFNDAAGDAEPATDDVAPADDSGDDLFDPAPADDAAPTGDAAPADDAAGGDDLFDAAPADDAAGGDDLFDAAPADDAAGGDDLFDAAPADDAAGGDDLFDAAPADDAAGGDDLFDAAPADDAAGGDDLFDAAPADDAGGDDLFDEGAADDADDLFGQQRTPDGMRVWTDNTGSYQTVGRLVVIAKTHVRLLKSNGRYSTVPLTRLSEADLDYVMAVAVKLTQTERLASR